MSDSEVTQTAFQAEVRQLLDIVIHSLYTDQEIFVRELISNASDALEKVRLKQLTEKEIFDADLPLEINMTTDETAKTITISDYGIGMTREELGANFGDDCAIGIEGVFGGFEGKGGWECFGDRSVWGGVLFGLYGGGAG